MSSALSTYTHKLLLNTMFGSGSPATIYIAAYSVLPDMSGVGGTEFTGGAYARASLTNNDTNFPAATDDGTTATQTIATAAAFPESTTDHGTCLGFGFLDAASGGNFLGLYELSTGQAVPAGIVLTVNAGGTITLAAA